ncbi:MAG TPA: hypothetical protein VHQ47_03345 [Phycisphaerae bacterium]|nr:hypothetical protein [Phycisphaerae bacterium]
MDRRDAYLFYEAGQAVAAAHLGLAIRHVSGNPVRAATEIMLPRNQPKARMILWLTAMAAEKRGAGAADPLRRTRTRQRIRAAIESIAAGMKGTPHQRLESAKALLNQAQDRANAICSSLYQAVEEVAERLRTEDFLPGAVITEIVKRAKDRRAKGDGEPAEPAAEKSEEREA